MSEDTLEAPRNLNIVEDTRNLLDLAKETLISSGEFTQEVLRLTVANGRPIDIPQAQTSNLPDGSIRVGSDALEDAATEAFFNGRLPGVHARFRLGDSGQPTYHEYDVSFHNRDTMELQHRERDTKDRQPESLTAPWDTLVVRAFNDAPSVSYLGKEKIMEPTSAIAKGKELVSGIQKATRIPRR